MSPAKSDEGSPHPSPLASRDALAGGEGGPFEHRARLGVRVDRATDIAEAIKKGIAANKPYLIDIDIAADINPAGAGVWELPGLGISKPAIGTRYEPA